MYIYIYTHIWQWIYLNRTLINFPTQKLTKQKVLNIKFPFLDGWNWVASCISGSHFMEARKSTKHLWTVHPKNWKQTNWSINSRKTNILNPKLEMFLELQGQPFINGWKWWFPTISHVKILNHPIETTIKNWLALEFQVDTMSFSFSFRGVIFKFPAVGFWGVLFFVEPLPIYLELQGQPVLYWMIQNLYMGNGWKSPFPSIL